MPEPKRTLSDKECFSKALECRQLAKGMHDPAHRAMLERMADAWDRLADDMRRKAPHHECANFTAPP